MNDYIMAIKAIDKLTQEQQLSILRHLQDTLFWQKQQTKIDTKALFDNHGYTLKEPFTRDEANER